VNDDYSYDLLFADGRLNHHDLGLRLGSERSADVIIKTVKARQLLKPSSAGLNLLTKN
jgi:hypothetical protein